MNWQYPGIKVEHAQGRAFIYQEERDALGWRWDHYQTVDFIECKNADDDLVALGIRQPEWPAAAKKAAIACAVAVILRKTTP